MLPLRADAIIPRMGITLKLCAPVTLLLVIIQHHHLGVFGQAAGPHAQALLRSHVPRPHRAQEPVDALQLAREERRAIVHRHYDVRLDRAHYLGSESATERVPSADRDQQDVDLIESFDLFLRQAVPQVAEVADRKPAEVEQKDCILSLLAPLPGIVIGGDAGDKAPPISYSPGALSTCGEPRKPLTALCPGCGWLTVTTSARMRGRS